MQTKTTNPTIVKTLELIFARFCKANEAAKSTAAQIAHRNAAWEALTDEERDQWEDLACFLLHPSEELEELIGGAK